MTVTSASTYIIGKPRTGKSTLLETLILRDIDAGLGVCVIDPHSDLVRGVMAHMPPSRADDVILLDLLAPDVAFGINPFACENANDPIAVERTVTRVMQIFERLWGFGTQNSSWGPRLEQHLRSVTLVLLEHGLTMTEAPLLLSLTDSSIRQHLIKTLGNPQIRAFWEEFESLTKREKEMRIESTSNKLAAFVDTPLGRHIVGQEEDTINWRSAMDAGKIVLVKLDAQLADLSGLIGSVIVGRILEAGLSRENDAVRRPFHLYCDEFQRFATDDFARLLTETGKWGIQTTVAHQYRGQLDERNRGATLQAGNLVVFSVSGEDATELAGNFKVTIPDPPVPREVPIRVPAAHVINHLLHHGHANPEVIRRARTFFAPFQGSWFEAGKANGLSQWEDRYLRDRWMTGKIGSFYPGAEKGLDQMDALLVAIHRSEHDNLNSLAVAQELYCIADMLGKYLSLAGFGGTGCEYVLARPDAQALLSGFACPQVFFPCPSWYSWESARVDLWLEEFLPMYERRSDGRPLSGYDYYLLTGEWLDEEVLQPHHRRTFATEIVVKEQKRFQAFWEAFMQLAELLRREPIMIDSGQYETIYEPSRTYSDVSDQIANELVTLPRFCAKTRYQGVEETIAVAPVALPKTHVPIVPAGRNRRDVVAALEQRHRQLRDDSSPPPPSAPRTPNPQTPPPTRPHLADGLPPRLPAAFHPVDD
jgi:hypothetical protein